MPVSQLPDFEHACTVSAGYLDPGELSECHGVACGLICLRPGAGADEFLSQLALLELAPDPSAELSGILGDLHRAATRQLDDEQMRFALWLPADDENLEDRTAALSRWCTGFLAGLGSAGAALESLSGEAEEALEDLRQIAMVEVASGGDSEEQEVAFAEIVEYIRVITLMLREDMSPPPHEPIH